MRNITVERYDAFTRIPYKGNPSGVVMDATTLTDDEMQLIASKVGYNETAFILPSNKADLRIRYFTPGHEMNLCGHGTVASIYALKEKGLLQKEHLLVETLAGILHIKVNNKESINYVYMEQAKPQFQPYNGSIDALVKSIGITAADIDERFPIVYGSTGIWTLVVPVKSLEVCARMQPNNAVFPDVLTDMPRASIHPFCLQTTDENADMHARHFSSPYSGTIEDPVTGTASGVLGAYYATYINQSKINYQLLIEQGLEIDKEGKVEVFVDAKKNVHIQGPASYAETLEIEL